MRPNKRQVERVAAKAKPANSIATTDSQRVTVVSANARSIKPNTRTVQSTLDGWKSKNDGQKTLATIKSQLQQKPKDVPKRTLRRQPNVKVEPQTDAEETGENVDKSDSHTEAKQMPTKSDAPLQRFACEHCNLQFTSLIWLKKHILKNHADASDEPERVPNVIVKMPELNALAAVKAKTKILNVKQELNNRGKVLKQINKIHAEQTSAVKRTLSANAPKSQRSKKAKQSPKKSILREQLKQQLEEQRKLLKVQQEIFEKANKTQNDIYELLAKMGDDEDEQADAVESEEEAAEEEEEAEEQEQYERIAVRRAAKRPSSTRATAPAGKRRSQKIVYETVDTDQYIVPDDELFYEEQQVADEPTVSQENYILLNDIEGDIVSNEQNMYVVMQNEDGDDEFELIDVIDEQAMNGNDDMENIDFEIVCDDSDGMHCRIIAGDPLDDARMPVKVDVDKISSIAQKRLKSSLKAKEQSEASTNRGMLLNKSMHRTTKQTNDFIQKIIQKAKPTGDNKFECPICHELVSNRYSLGPHVLRLHSKQKEKICPHCDRAFTCTGDLTRHIRIHTGDKPFKCTYQNCTYAFRASGDLHKHLRRHNTTTENIRQHSCTICSRSFERNYDLKRHCLTHRKNEEGVGYDCEFCSKRFVRKDQHKAHVFRHLGIKPYQCPDCGRSFGDFSNCAKHIKQCQAGDVAVDGADGAQFTCDICMKRFKSKPGFQQHTLKCAKLSKLQKELQDSIRDDNSTEQDSDEE